KRLRLRRQAGRLAHDRAATRDDASNQPVAEAYPVTDGDLDVVVHEPTGQAGTYDLPRRLHVEPSAMRGGHASPPVAGRQVVGELRCPPERAEIELGQRNAPFRDARTGRRDGRLPIRELCPSRG